MVSFSSASYSKWDDDRTWSSQDWKTDFETYERSQRPDEISWGIIRKVRPGFSHDEIRLDGTAQSVRNEETSWQIGATWYRFSRKGTASTICHWKWQSRIGIVSRIKIIRESGEWSGAKKTEEFRMLQKMEKNSMIWRMFMVVTMESAVSMGKMCRADSRPG